MLGCVVWALPGGHRPRFSRSGARSFVRSFFLPSSLSLLVRLFGLVFVPVWWLRAEHIFASRPRLILNPLSLSSQSVSPFVAT